MKHSYLWITIGMLAALVAVGCDDGETQTNALLGERQFYDYVGDSGDYVGDSGTPPSDDESRGDYFGDGGLELSEPEPEVMPEAATTGYGETCNLTAGSYMTPAMLDIEGLPSIDDTTSCYEASACVTPDDIYYDVPELSPVAMEDGYYVATNGVLVFPRRPSSPAFRIEGCDVSADLSDMYGQIIVRIEDNGTSVEVLGWMISYHTDHDGEIYLLPVEIAHDLFARQEMGAMICAPENPSDGMSFQALEGIEFGQRVLPSCANAGDTMSTVLRVHYAQGLGIERFGDYKLTPIEDETILGQITFLYAE